MKPCYFCGKTASVTFDAEAVFDCWAEKNGIICAYRSRFDGVREALHWASVDESDKGAHPECALRWAVECEGFGKRYPNCNLEKPRSVPLVTGIIGPPGGGKTFSALRLANGIKDKLES
jgi:hypothetical protein